jgi:hypothetical protein
MVSEPPLLQRFNKRGAFRSAADKVDAFDFQLLCLRQASAYCQQGVRVPLPQLAHGVSRFFIGGGCDRAGVDYHSFRACIAYTDDLVSLFAEHFRHSGGFGLICAAS